MNAGTTIRRAREDDAESIARVRIEGWRTAYRGLVPQSSLDALNVETSVPMWQRVLAAPTDRVTVYVAERDGGIVGFAAGNALPEPRHGFDAELTAIHVVPGAQRQGLARRLTGAVAADRAAHGATGLIVWLLAGNRPARQFCESLGAEVVAEQAFDWDGKALVEVGCGWRNLGTLVAAAGLSALH